MAELNMGSILRKLNHKTESGIAKKISSFEDNFINVWENPEKTKSMTKALISFLIILILKNIQKKEIPIQRESMNNIQGNEASYLRR